MIVVADSSPIRYLVLIEQAHLLPALYGTIIIPPGVVSEGEREAIALAEELSADALLADDGAARLEAGRRNIAVQGTLGILDLAAEHGLANFEGVIRRLMSTNFRAGAELIQFFLDRDMQRKNRDLERGH